LLDREIVREGDEVLEIVHNWVKVNNEIAYSAALCRYPIRRKISQDNIERNDSGKERQPLRGTQQPQPETAEVDGGN